MIVTCKVTKFMGKLFAQHGHTHRNAGQNGLAEGGADAETVDEIVDAVAKYDHPGDGGDAIAWPTQ